MEGVRRTKFLRGHTGDNLFWITNTTSLAKMPQQHFHFLQRLRKASVPLSIISTFYRCAIKSFLTNCLVWKLQHLWADIPTEDEYRRKTHWHSFPVTTGHVSDMMWPKSHENSRWSFLPLCSLLTLLPSGKGYRSISDRSTRLLNSFIPSLWEIWKHCPLNPKYYLILFQPFLHCPKERSLGGLRPEG